MKESRLMGPLTASAVDMSIAILSATRIASSNGNAASPHKTTIKHLAIERVGNFTCGGNPLSVANAHGPDIDTFYFAIATCIHSDHRHYRQNQRHTLMTHLLTNAHR